MSKLKQEINHLEDRVIKLLFDALLEYQEKSGKEYFVIDGGYYIGVKYIDPQTDVYAIPLGSIYADDDGNIRYCGREEYALPDFYNTMYDYEDVDNYMTLKRGDIIMSDIYELYELVIYKTKQVKL